MIPLVIVSTSSILLSRFTVLFRTLCSVELILRLCSCFQKPPPPQLHVSIWVIFHYTHRANNGVRFGMHFLYQSHRHCVVISSQLRNSLTLRVDGNFKYFSISNYGNSLRASSEFVWWTTPDAQLWTDAGQCSDVGSSQCTAFVCSRSVWSCFWEMISANHTIGNREYIVHSYCQRLLFYFERYVRMSYSCSLSADVDRPRKRIGAVLYPEVSLRNFSEERDTLIQPQ